MRVGRNDPCPCGSGKKYKNCCMLKERAAQSSTVIAQRDYEELLDALLSFSQSPAFSVDLVSAFNLYWNGDYGSPGDAHLPQPDVLRFFEWYLFDYVTWKSQKRFTELLLEDGGLTASKREMLANWLGTRASVYGVVDASPERSILLRDLLREGEQRVQDELVSSIVQAGEVVVGRLLPVGSGLRLAFAPTLLPPQMGAGLVDFVRRAWQSYRDAHYGAEYADFLGSMSYLFNHYLLQNLPDKPLPPKYYDITKAVSALEKARQQASPDALEELLQGEKRPEDELEIPGTQTIAGGRLLIPAEPPVPEPGEGERTAAGGKILLP